MMMMMMQESFFGIYHGVEQLGHKVYKCSTLGNVNQLFKIIYIPTSPMLEILSLALHPLQYWVLSEFFIFAN